MIPEREGLSSQDAVWVRAAYTSNHEEISRRVSARHYDSSYMDGPEDECQITGVVDDEGTTGVQKDKNGRYAKIEDGDKRIVSKGGIGSSTGLSCV